MSKFVFIVIMPLGADWTAALQLNLRFCGSFNISSSRRKKGEEEMREREAAAAS